MVAQLHLVEAPPSDRAVERYRCACGQVDTEGGPGPVMVFGEPGAYGCASSRWFCRRCIRALWRQHDARQREREARLERLDRYRQGLLDFQAPGVKRWLSHEDHARVCARLAREAA